VTVANADNGKTGAGALWDYSTKLGSDNALTGGETSAALNVRFNNPKSESFTVTFNVIGNLVRSTSSSPGGGGGSSSSSPPSATSTVANLVFSVAYNPVLNTLTWQVLKQ